MDTLSNKEQTKASEAKFLWSALIVLMLAQIGTSGDNAVLSVATSALIESLEATMNDIQLVNVIYSLCAGSFMIVGGMLGIIIGWRRNFRIGAALCAIGEIIIALSTNVFVLTWGGRLAVGIGASLMIPSVLGLVAGIYKGKDRAVAFGAIGAATGIASFIAPVVAGLLIDSFGWRIAFGFMGCYFISILLGSILIPNVERSPQRVKMDYIGAVTAAVGLFLLIVGISKTSVWGLIAPIKAPFTVFGLSPALPMVLLGILILVALVPIEKRIEEKNGAALIPQSFLKTPQVRNGVYLQAMLFLCFGGAGFLINTYLQLVGGFSAMATGFAMVAMAIPMVIFSIGVPKFMPNASPKNISRLGIIIAAISTIPMAMSLTNTGVTWMMYVGLFAFGTGQGLVSSQSSNIVATAVNERDAQQSGGIQTASRNVGQAVGVALLGMVMLFSMTGSIQNTVATSQGVSVETQEKISELQGINFMSNQNSKILFEPMVKDDKELQILLDINAEARKSSTQKGILALGVLTLLFLFGTSKIPHSFKTE